MSIAIRSSPVSWHGENRACRQGQIAVDLYKTSFVAVYFPVQVCTARLNCRSYLVSTYKPIVSLFQLLPVQLGCQGRTEAEVFDCPSRAARLIEGYLSYVIKAHEEIL